MPRAANGISRTDPPYRPAPAVYGLPDDLVFRARRHGVRFAVDTDAHAVRNFDNLRYGVAMAQRGWLTADDVINTWPIERLREFVEAKRRIAD